MNRLKRELSSIAPLAVCLVVAFLPASLFERPFHSAAEEQRWLGGILLKSSALAIAAGLAAATATAGWRRTAIAAAALFLTLGVSLHYGVIDDAYITLRYARHLSEGIGPVWNPGERVEGSSSFFWVLAMASSHRLTGIDLDTLARVAGAAGAVVALGALAWACAPFSSVAVALAAYLPFAFWGFSGMETTVSLAVSILLLATAADRRATSSARRLVALGALAGLSVWIRPEAVLLAGVVGVWVAGATERGSRARSSVAYVSGLALALVPLLAFRLVYYGDLLPNTYYVKVDGSGPALWARGVRYLGDHLPPLAPIVCLAAVSALRASRSRLGLLALLWVGAQVATILFTGGDHFDEARFCLPIVAASILVIGQGMPLTARLPRAMALALLALVTLQLSFRHRDLARTSAVYFGRAITERWMQAGLWLGENARPGDVVATPVAGALPFFSGLLSIDLYGLNDRVIARRDMPLGGGRADHEKFDSEYVLARRPDYIYLGPFEMRDWREARAKTARMAGLADLLDRVSPEEYELVNGRRDGAAFAFLRRRESAAPSEPNREELDR